MDIIIFKPKTSRIANSEKYVICRGFKGITDDEIENLINILKDWNTCDTNNELLINSYCNKRINGMNNNIKESNNKLKIINNIFKKDESNSVFLSFIEYIKKQNKEIVDNQVENINYTIIIIKKNKRKELDNEWFNNNRCNQVDSAYQWCKDNNIPHN